jgi:hypothetical protein
MDQSALDRMEARIYADPSLMTIRRCTVEHPFGTIKRMSGGGRFLTRGLIQNCGLADSTASRHALEKAPFSQARESQRQRSLVLGR